MYFLVTGFLIRFFSGSGSVPIFLVNRFDDRSSSGNFDLHNVSELCNLLALEMIVQVYLLAILETNIHYFTP
jgi:hypothetical protein